MAVQKIQPIMELKNKKFYIQNFVYKNWLLQGGSPGLAVNDWDSQYEGLEFKSQRRIIVVKFVLFAWKDCKISEKEAKYYPF